MAKKTAQKRLGTMVDAVRFVEGDRVVAIVQRIHGVIVQDVAGSVLVRWDSKDHGGLKESWFAASSLWAEGDMLKV